MWPRASILRAEKSNATDSLSTTTQLSAIDYSVMSQRKKKKRKKKDEVWFLLISHFIQLPQDLQPETEVVTKANINCKESNISKIFEVRPPMSTSKKTHTKNPTSCKASNIIIFKYFRSKTYIHKYTQDQGRIMESVLDLHE